MPATMNDLVVDWRRSRDALSEQLRLMNNDQAFPDVTLSVDARASVARELLGLMARFDHLIEKYGNADRT
jgi:hypothetical protein